jgi:acyl carrier protein
MEQEFQMKQNLLGRLGRHFGLGQGNEPAMSHRPDETAIRTWLVERLAKRLKMTSAEIDSSKPFADYGLDSIVAVQVAGELEKLVEKRLSPALLFEYPTIDDVAAFLAKATRADVAVEDQAEVDQLLEIGVRS